MIKKLLPLILLLTGITGYAEDYMNVIIDSNNKSAMIFIDDEFIGNGKVELKLAPGSYKLLIVERNRGWNAESFSDSLKVTDKSIPIKKYYKFKNELYVDSVPQNASLIINDTTFAHTPVFISNSFNDPITVAKTNYLPKQINISEINSTTTVSLDFTGNSKEKHFVDTPWFKVLIGSAVILGASAAYFKIQADQKYDEYQATRDRTLLDDVDRLDLYSGLSFGLLQVNFGYLIYRFIFDHPGE